MTAQFQRPAHELESPVPSELSPSHTEAVFECGGRWFFLSLSGAAMGPFASRFEAEIEAGLLREMQRASMLPGVA